MVRGSLGVDEKPRSAEPMRLLSQKLIPKNDVKPRVGVGSAKKMLFKRGSSDYIRLRTPALYHSTHPGQKLTVGCPNLFGIFSYLQRIFFMCFKVFSKDNSNDIVHIF